MLTLYNNKIVKHKEGQRCAAVGNVKSPSATKPVSNAVFWHYLSSSSHLHSRLNNSTCTKVNPCISFGAINPPKTRIILDNSNVIALIRLNLPESFQAVLATFKHDGWRPKDAAIFDDWTQFKTDQTQKSIVKENWFKKKLYLLIAK